MIWWYIWIQKHCPYVVYVKLNKALYLKVLKTIYGMPQSSLLLYIRLETFLETNGFKFNSYDPGVANKIMEGDPLTVVSHLDEVNASHEEKNVVDNFEQWINFMYEYQNIGKVKSMRVKVHEYLSMISDYTTKGEVIVDIQK